jgi:hypothetical protein
VADPVAVRVQAHGASLLLRGIASQGRRDDVFAIRTGRISDVKLGRVVFAKYDPFFGLLL